MASVVPVKNYTTGKCGHLIFHLDPHDKCIECRKSKCDFHENCCDLCGSLSNSIIRTLRRLYLKNKRPVHQMSPSPSPSQSRCSSKARDTPIAELMSSAKPSKKSKCRKATATKSAGRVHMSDCTSTANTTATLEIKEVEHVVKSIPHAVELSGAICTNSVDSVNVAINDLTGYDHSNARGCVSVVSPQSQDVMSTNRQRQMRHSGSIPVSVTIHNNDIQHCVTAANASHMTCSTYRSGAYSSPQFPWTFSAIPMTEDNGNSVCGISDEVSPASDLGRAVSGAQTRNLRPPEHQFYSDTHHVSPVSAERKVPCKSAQDAQGKPLNNNDLKAPCKSAQDAQEKPMNNNERKAPCKSAQDAQRKPLKNNERKAPCKSAQDAQGKPLNNNERKAPCKSAQDAQGKPLSNNEQIPMRLSARTISHQPRGSPSAGRGIETAQSHHQGPTDRQCTTYGIGHSEGDYYVSSKLKRAPDMSPRYEDVSENEKQIRHYNKRTHYVSSSNTDSQARYIAKKRRYSEIHGGRETVKYRNQESVHGVYEHSDNYTDNQVLTVKEYNNSTNKLIASITECEGGVQKNSGSSNVSGMFDNILGESSKVTESYLLPASNTTKYMINHFNTVLRGNTVKGRKGRAWTEEELQDIPKVSETSKSTGLLTNGSTKIVKRSGAFTMFDQPDLDKDRIYSRNMYEDRQLRDLERDTCSAIASNNRLELATLSAINLTIASVPEEEYDMRLKQELTPLLNAINESA